MKSGTSVIIYEQATADWDIFTLTARRSDRPVASTLAGSIVSYVLFAQKR
jgi:hypothetical protein